MAASAIAIVLAVFFVVPQPLWNGHAAGPRPATAADSDPARWLLALAYALAWTLPFRPFVGALKLIERGASQRFVLALTALLALAALLIYPAYGSDVLVYAAYGRLFAVYGEHPLMATPALHPSDWTFPYVWFPYQPSPYGPLWALLSGAIALLSGTSSMLVVLAYKLVALAGYVGCCMLLWLQTRRLHTVAAFAWNPLVLFEVLGKAHNDVLLALAALLALRLLRGSSLVVTAVGALIKLSLLPMLPALAVDLARRRQRRAIVLGSLGACAVLVAAYAPFWQGPETILPVLAQTSRVVWSPGSLLIALGIDATITRIALAAVWLAACALILLRVRDVAVSAALLLLASLLLLTTAFFAHYLVPVIALTATRKDQRLVLALSIGSLAAYATDMLPGDYHVLGSLLLITPAAMAAGWWLLRRALPSGRPRPVEKSSAVPG